MDIQFYAAPGPLTTLTPGQTELVRAAACDPMGLCRIAQGLLISPHDAAAAGLPEQRLTEGNIRPASAVLHRAWELGGDTPLDHPRPAEQRVVGTCRHFAVLSTSFLRAVDVPARARCGFAAYFVPDKFVDHWIVECWASEEGRWIRIDPEYVNRAPSGVGRADDLRPGEFLTGGEAWQLVRSGAEDPADFGVAGTSNWGVGEVRGNAMRDLASLVRKIEMLPWDEWGPMRDSYDGTTGDVFDVLMDELAVACRDEHPTDLERVFEHLAVPANMIC